MKKREYTLEELFEYIEKRKPQVQKEIIQSLGYGPRMDTTRKKSKASQEIMKIFEENRKNKNNIQ